MHKFSSTVTSFSEINRDGDNDTGCDEYLLPVTLSPNSLQTDHYKSANVPLLPSEVWHNKTVTS